MSASLVSARAAPIPTLCAALYLAAVFAVFLTILHRDDGVFTYSLDDPYIHLSLARSLAHGHYGIDLNEASSPSSSILWPFLLVPFARLFSTGYAPLVYVPLAWNILFCTASAWMIGRIVERLEWLPKIGDSKTPPLWVRLGIALLLMLVANLVGITFVGMEHGLQIPLAVACAAGLIEALAGRPIPQWAVAAAVLGPLVRYENFALLAAMALALYGQRRARAAAAICGLALIGPVLFAMFLLSRGLPALPSSVLVKAMVYSHPAFGGAVGAAAQVVVQSLYWGLGEFTWYLQFLVFALLVWLARRQSLRPQRFALCAAAVAALLQLLVGRYNWFYRYEVYALTFTTLVAVAEVARSTRARYASSLAGLALVASPYGIAILQTPLAAADIYRQQYQMRRFVADYYRGTVAVNDLGLVSYQRPPGVEVLDLWGLASPEASRHPNKDRAWLEVITRSHHANLAILYPGWYPEGAPSDWKPLGTLCVTAPRMAISRRCVVFYSTAADADPETARAEAAAFASFATTVPSGVKVTLGVDSSDRDDEEPATIWPVF